MQQMTDHFPHGRSTRLSHKQRVFARLAEGPHQHSDLGAFAAPLGPLKADKETWLTKLCHGKDDEYSMKRHPEQSRKITLSHFLMEKTLRKGGATTHQSQ